MGRPFAGELMAMNDTYDTFLAYNIDKILDFLENSLIQPILCIGSGGSYAVAKSFSLLASTLGCFSKTITPFELLNEKGLNRSNVIIFTAGGNNPDTLNAYIYQNE